MSSQHDNKYYLYRHVRLDKNEPFYIGIGTKPAYYCSYEVEFNRAYSVKGRNNIWNKIYNKTEVAVEIIMESSDRELICNKEKEFIAIYKSINSGGILANLSDGGDGGTLGYKHSEVTKQKIGTASRNRERAKNQMSPERRKRIGDLNRRSVVVTKLTESLNFDSVGEAMEFLDIGIRHMSRLISSKKCNKSGYFITYKTNN